LNLYAQRAAFIAGPDDGRHIFYGLGTAIKHRLGLRGISYFHATPSWQPDAGIRMSTTAEIDASGREYIAQDLHLIDPLLPFAMQQIAPFLWSELPAKANPLNSRDPRVSGWYMKMALTLGDDWGCGFGLPMFGPVHSRGFFSIALPRKLVATPALIKQTRLELWELHNEYCAWRLRGLKPPRYLTGRQQQALQLTQAQGLPLETAAARMGISIGTLREHLDAARKKLGVSSNEAAAYKAIGLGLML
jgi:DNA-binding CsgD family transcriptional regulator